MRSRAGLLVPVLGILFLVISDCVGKFVVEKNSLKITYPDSINGTYECAIGNFGVPKYGGSMAGIIVYPKSNQIACADFKDFDLSLNSKPGHLPTFLLADRGDCTFVNKTWNAQLGGAAAILVADDVDEELITMDSPQSGNDADEILIQNITIASFLITKSLGDKLKKSLSSGKMVKARLDWTEALPHPDDRVEYEFWTNSNNECGVKCDSQIEFVKEFKGAAQILEKKGHTQFTPHYITWFCPEEFIPTKQCESQCINNGRYCTPDPEGDLNVGYDGKDVVTENLRQACFFRVANESGRPWLWWDYVTDFAIRCPMKENKFNKACADQVIKSIGFEIKKIDDCIGDINADVVNPVLQSEQQAQMGVGARGDITILPTLVINDRQYRGKLDRGAVLKAICSGFNETTEPSICLTGDVETNQCLLNNGGCWQDMTNNITACKDTFRGRVCECPTVQRVKFVGDGYTRCEASGSLRCEFGNGGCWKERRDNLFYSACFEDSTKGCECPFGFRGDGVDSCEDVDECKEKLACQCPGCQCKNTWGSYECSCSGGLLYMHEHDTCITRDSPAGFNWGIFWIVVLVLASAAAAGYVLYKYRIRRYMDSEIRGIMAQYMPLEDHDHTVEAPNPTQRLL